MMHTTETLYDSLYQAVIRQGWPGWGGQERLAKGPGQVARILAHPSVPRMGKILELGCGEGHLCRLLSRSGYDVAGIDISFVAICWAQEKNAIYHTNIRYIHGDFSDHNVSVHDQYDLIIDGNCFHCIIGERRSVFLKNVYKNLAKNGIFFISSLCSQDASNHILLRYDEPYRHIPTSETLKDEIQQEGFHVLDSRIQKHTYRQYDHINLFVKKA
jgi:2-polyprenyl-3-methyl-5-hydroxy-6-metoxy-1,4-benzoquinol methylase